LKNFLNLVLAGLTINSAFSDQPEEIYSMVFLYIRADSGLLKAYPASAAKSTE
jgi:hypothetical protein